MVWEARALPYLFRRRQLLDLFVEHSLHAFALLRNDMLRSIESHTIAEYQSDIGNELIRSHITRISQIGIRLDRIRCHQFAFDGREIHGMFDDLKIMRYLQSLGINRKTERSSVLQLFESPDCGERKFVLRYAKG
jgi:hypothetical protein